MGRIEELLLTRMQSAGPRDAGERKLSIIIEARDGDTSGEVLEKLEADGAEDIRSYSFLNSVAARVPVSRISGYERMPGVAKLWDGVGNVVVPPMPEVRVQPELSGSLPLVMDHPVYRLADKLPGDGAPIDGKGVKVCIIDTGIDREHPDLRARIAKVSDFTDDGDGRDYMGHGTHVAGIVAGSGRGSGGRFRGLSPGAELYVAKVFDRSGYAPRTAILDAIEWAVGEEVDIINMSLGSALPGCDGTCHLCRASDWAASQGIVVVISSGNEGPEPGTVVCPANSRDTLSVGAVDDSKGLAWFSSRGPTLDGRPKPDVVAPGVNIEAPRAGDTSMGLPRDEFYTVASGTSMAAPYAAGAAALLHQLYAHYSAMEYGRALRLEPREMKAFLMQGSDSMGEDINDGGRGLLNLPLAVKALVDAERLPGEVLQERGSPEPSRTREGGVEDRIETAVNVARTHLQEIGVPLECKLHFFDDRNEVVYSLGGEAPREKLNVPGIMGLYKPATGAGYVRLASLPEMASTVAHEAAHHHLLSRSPLGRVLKELDVIYEVYKEGHDLRMREVMGEVREDRRRLFEISRVVNEGFAMWAGHRVLRRFVDVMKGGAFREEGIDMNALKNLIEGYEHLSDSLDGRHPQYYYGRLEFRRLEESFGPASVSVAAIMCMGVRYDKSELPSILEAHNMLMWKDRDLLHKNLEALRTSPNLRLIALSRLLPERVRQGDDISRLDDPDYLLSAVKRYMGEGFLEEEVSGSEARVRAPEGSVDTARVALGEILAQLAYGNGRGGDSLLSELSAIADREVVSELSYYRDHLGGEDFRERVREVLNRLKASDRNVEIGAAVGKLEFLEERDDILNALAILKDYNEDAGDLYEFVRAGDFEASWPEYLKRLKREIGVR